MTSLIVPEKLETDAVRRGRSIILQVMDRVLELHDKGRSPRRIEISTANCDDLRAFFDYAYVFDGVLPQTLANVPLVYVPGADRRIQIVCDGEQ